jgi:hypothetical protein
MNANIKRGNRIGLPAEPIGAQFASGHNVTVVIESAGSLDARMLSGSFRSGSLSKAARLQDSPTEKIMVFSCPQPIFCSISVI